MTIGFGGPQSQSSGGTVSFGGGGGIGERSYTASMADVTRRMKLIAGAVPGAANHPEVLYALAQGEGDDADVLDAATEALSHAEMDRWVTRLSSKPNGYQRAEWEMLTRNQQEMLIDGGYTPPPDRSDDDDSIFDDFGDVVGGALAGIMGAGKGFVEKGGQALHILDVAGDTFQHIHRTTRMVAADMDVEGRSLARRGQDTFGWTPPEDGLLGGIYKAGQAGQGNAWANTALELVTNPTRVWRAFMETGVGERTFLPQSRMEAEDILAGDEKKMTVLLEEMAGYSIEEQAQRAANPQAAYADLMRLRDSKDYQKAKVALSNGRISFGRDIARQIGLHKDDSKVQGAISGSIDAGMLIFLDPTLVGGKLNKARKMSKYGINWAAGGADDIARMDEIFHSDAATKRAFEVVARRASNREWAQLARELPGSMHYMGELDEYVKRGGKLDSAEDVLGFFQSKIGVSTLLQGKTGSYINDFASMPRLTTAHKATSSVKQKMREVIDFTAEAPIRVSAGADDLATKAIASKPLTLVRGTGKFLQGFTTQIPRRNAIQIGSDADLAEISRLVDMGVWGKMTRADRDMWFNTLVDATDSRRMVAVRSFLDDLFAKSGLTQTAEGREWAGRFVEANAQLYDSYGAHAGVLAQGDRAHALVIPAFREMVTNTRQAKLVAGQANRLHLWSRLYGGVNNGMVDAFMGTVWKPSVLLRVGFIPRAAGEELMGFVFRDASGFVKNRLAHVAALDERTSREAVLARLVDPMIDQKTSVKVRQVLKGTYGDDWEKVDVNDLYATLRAEWRESDVWERGDIANRVHRLEGGERLLDNRLLRRMGLDVRIGRSPSATTQGGNLLTSFAFVDRTIDRVLATVDLATLQKAHRITQPVDIAANHMLALASRWTRSTLQRAVDPTYLRYMRLALTDPSVERAFMEMVSTGSVGRIADSAEHITGDRLAPREFHVGTKADALERKVLIPLKGNYDDYRQGDAMFAHMLHEAAQRAVFDDNLTMGEMAQVAHRYVNPQTLDELKRFFSIDDTPRTGRIDTESMSDAEYVNLLEMGDEGFDLAEMMAAQPVDALDEVMVRLNAIRDIETVMPGSTRDVVDALNSGDGTAFLARMMENGVGDELSMADIKGFLTDMTDLSADTRKWLAYWVENGLTDDLVPIVGADELSEVLFETARKGLLDPKNRQNIAAMQNSVIGARSRMPVVQPVPAHHGRVYVPTVNRSTAEALLDMSFNDPQALLNLILGMRHMDHVHGASGAMELVTRMRENASAMSILLKESDEPAVPLGLWATNDPRLAKGLAEMFNDVLKSPVEDSISQVSYIDVLDDELKRMKMPIKSALNETPAGHYSVDLPHMQRRQVVPENGWVELPNGDIGYGISQEQAIDEWASAYVDRFFQLYGGKGQRFDPEDLAKLDPSGTLVERTLGRRKQPANLTGLNIGGAASDKVNFALLSPIAADARYGTFGLTRQRSKIDDVFDVDAADYPEFVNGPKLVDPSTNMWNEFVQWGFGRIAHYIDGIVRTPLFTHNFVRAMSQNERALHWLLEPALWDDVEEIAETAIMRPTIANWDTLTPEEQALFPGFGESGKKGIAAGLDHEMGFGEPLQRKLASIWGASNTRLVTPDGLPHNNLIHNLDQVKSLLDEAIEEHKSRLPFGRSKADDFGTEAEDFFPEHQQKMFEKHSANDLPYQQMLRLRGVLDKLQVGEIQDGISRKVVKHLGDLSKITKRLGNKVSNVELVEAWQTLPARMKKPDIERTEWWNEISRLRHRTDLSDEAADVLHNLQDHEIRTLRAAAKNYEYASGQMRDASLQRAINDTVPFIDDHHIRSQFQEHARNIVPFWFAEEQFLKRWARQLKHSPELLRRGQLTYQGLHHVGVIKENEYGEAVFYVPGTGPLNELLQSHWGKKLFGGYEMPTFQLSGQIKRSFPGMDQAGAPSFSPIVGVASNMLTRRFKELAPIDKAIGGGRATEGLAESFVPASIARFWQAATQHHDSEGQMASAMIQAMQIAEAHGNTPEPDATAAQVDEYLDRLEDHARIIMITRALVGLVSPASPQIEFAEDELNETFVSYLRNMPPTEAIDRFLEDHPNASAWTVFGTEKKSGAPLPATEESLRFMAENENWLKTFEYAGPWFLPMPDPGDTSSVEAYFHQMSREMRERKDPGEYYRNLKFAQASGDYFASKEAYEKSIEGLEGEQKAEITAAWQAWKVDYLNAHPIFAEDLESGEGRIRRAKVLKEMRLAVRDPQAPASKEKEQLSVIIDSFDSYTAARDRLATDRTARAAEMKKNLKEGFREWGEAFVMDNPQMRTFWSGVIAREAELD